jgi:hypothetical protein
MPVSMKPARGVFIENAILWGTSIESIEKTIWNAILSVSFFNIIQVQCNDTFPDLSFPGHDGHDSRRSIFCDRSQIF